MQPPYLLAFLSTLSICLPTYHTVLAEPPNTPFYNLCYNATSPIQPAFTRNLNLALSALSNRSSSALYSNYTSPGPSGNQVFAMYQCQGDLSLSQCSDCISHIRTDLIEGTCPNATGARIQLDSCFLRYANYFFFTPDFTPVLKGCNPFNNTNPAYQSNVNSALSSVVDTASRSGGFAALSVGNAYPNRVYSLAQCNGYLSQSECAQCLSQVSGSRLDYCVSQAAGGRVYFSSCYYRYEIYLFYIPSNVSSPSPSTPYNATGTKPHNTGSNGSHTAAITGVVLGTSIAILGIVGVGVLMRRRRKWKRRTKEGQEMEDISFQKTTTIFTLGELKEATNDFDPDNMLGEGGFGPVYKGTLPNGQVVAIKKLSTGSHQGMRQFLNEVNLITSVQHRNLIRLYGCCAEGPERLLVYEYLPNKSLDKFLFEPDDGMALDWRTRLEIILGTARGLSYLHEDAHVRIIHRDIKASNILLDDQLNAKIADFGLARLFTSYDSHITTGVAGTIGYLAPEYAMHGHLTEKVDIFSFAVVTLETLTGRRNIAPHLPPHQQRLLEWVWISFANDHHQDANTKETKNKQKQE